MKKVHLVGAVVASSALLVVIFAGSLGQLFTLSGGTGKMPAYGTTAVPNGWSGYADALMYDEKGELIDFSKIPGSVGTSENDSDTICPDRTYVFAVKDFKVWKKGSMLASVEQSIQRQLELALKACVPPDDTEFACATDCRVDGDDEVIEAQPLMMSLVSADGVGQGILQYVFSLNAGCIRVKHCVAG